MDLMMIVYRIVVVIFFYTSLLRQSGVVIFFHLVTHPVVVSQSVHVIWQFISSGCGVLCHILQCLAKLLLEVSLAV